MSVASQALDHFGSWIAAAAGGFIQLGESIQRRRKIELTEQPDGSFLPSDRARQPDELALRLEDGAIVGPTGMRSLLARSVVSIVLAPSQFVFRPLELPAGADAFLGGVVRSQIDRLTPWNGNDAAFGWSAPVRQGTERISVTVAATSRERLKPVVNAFLAAGAAHVLLSTRSDQESALVPLLDQGAAAKVGDHGLQRKLTGALATAAFALVVSFAAWIILGGRFSDQLVRLNHQSAERRAELKGKSGGAVAAIEALNAKKAASPSAVMTIEELSRILPDDVYLTELRIENGRVQISGAAKDAAALIPLLEQSHEFTHATFYAPTVRNSDGGESFHVEGHIEPSFAVMK